MESDYSDVIVCGSGPAGLAAADAAAETGASVKVLEKQDRIGGKLPYSGNGKCNFSNVLDDVPFMNAFGRAGRFMTDALRCGGRDWFCDHLRKHNVEVEAIDGFHYFPKSGDAMDIMNSFYQAKVVYEKRRVVTSVCLDENGAVCGVRVRYPSQVDEIFYPAKAVILACGGTAMSALGGTAAGLRVAEQLGHKIVQPLPAMAPLYLQEDWLKELSGVSLKHVQLQYSSGRNHGKTTGEMLFTHDGVSGPAALNLSNDAYRVWQDEDARAKFELKLNFDTTVDWRSSIDMFRKQESNKFLRSSLSTFLPKSLAFAICKHLGWEERKNQTLKDVERDQLVSLLTSCPLTIARLCPMERAMAMSGGVSWREIKPQTMESRLVPGLYFAGEMIDLTGPCGGYNIQFAVASGRLAGLSARNSWKNDEKSGNF